MLGRVEDNATLITVSLENDIRQNIQNIGIVAKGFQDLKALGWEAPVVAA